MILQPTSCKSHRYWILSSLVTTGLQKRGCASTQTEFRMSKRRQQLNNCLAELQQLGSTPVPLRFHKLPQWLANYRLLLTSACTADITPIFSNQIQRLLKQLADLIGKRTVFTPEAIEHIMYVALGPAPTPGHIDSLSACRPLAFTVGSFAARFRRDDKFVSWDCIKSQLLTNPPPEQCESMLTDSRSASLIKIMDLCTFASVDPSSAAARLHEWFIMDLECFLGTTSSLEERTAFVEGFLEVLACFQMPECHAPNSYLYELFTLSFLCLEQVHRRTWKSTCPMVGWRGISVAVAANGMEGTVMFTPKTEFHVQQSLKTTMETGLKFGAMISLDVQQGMIIPAIPKDLPEPGRFIVENGLLGLLTGFDWLNPDGCLDVSLSPSVASMPHSLESLVKRATKEYQKATRLVNQTLRLVTELAVEEGIQLSEEENTRLLEDIAASDSKGAMSRAWESSPIKGSVPPMIVQLTSQPPLPDLRKSSEADPMVDYIRAAVTQNPGQVDTYALLFLAGEALLGYFRGASLEDTIDRDRAATSMDTSLADLAERLPEGSSIMIERLALHAMRSVRQPSTIFAKNSLKELYEVVAPHLGLKASLPSKNRPTPLRSLALVPEPAHSQPARRRHVKKPIKRRNRVVNCPANRCVQSESLLDELSLRTDSPPLHSHTSSITPGLRCPPPSGIRLRRAFEFVFERQPLSVGTLSAQCT
ncbi:MAG: uncharacterized protein KVP18_001382 [Porospora cf. gigantea A]|uniref:uncharacterized protein n=2 Tax=Porospora cf. gigantea A TaxID=2853593 RepID=UPI003559D411|nr:MAG: hypothetical protein KVP18_001382 [Porospora cf. gigantea A]